MNLGASLKERLADFGLSEDQAARRAGLEPARLAAIISGATPALDELHGLGRVLVFDPHAIVRGEPMDDPTRSLVRFKTPEGAISTLVPEDVLLLARAAEVGRVGGWLLGLLGRDAKLLPLRQVLPVADNPKEWEQGYVLGENARDRIDGPPIIPLKSVRAFVESLDVHIAYVEFCQAGITAASIIEPGGLPVILVNRRSSRARSTLSLRAALAHELCHLLHDGGETSLAMVSAVRSQDGFEQRANGFAPAFLAPPDVVQDEHKADFSSSKTTAEKAAAVSRLAVRWGLSQVGATWHAKNCGLLPPGDAEYLAAETWPQLQTDFEGNGQRRDIPDSVDISDLPYGLFSDLVMEACQLTEISENRVGELLAL